MEQTIASGIQQCNRELQYHKQAACNKVKVKCSCNLVILINIHTPFLNCNCTSPSTTAIRNKLSGHLGGTMIIYLPLGGPPPPLFYISFEGFAKNVIFHHTFKSGSILNATNSNIVTTFLTITISCCYYGFIVL